MAAIVFNDPTTQPNQDLESQIENLQTTLASLNQAVYSLQDKLSERDQQILELKNSLTKCNKENLALKDLEESASEKPVDKTVTIIEGLIKLFKFITVVPGKEEQLPPSP